MPQPRITVRLPPEIGDATAEEAVRAIRAYRKQRTRVGLYRERRRSLAALSGQDAPQPHADAPAGELVNAYPSEEEIR